MGLAEQPFCQISLIGDALSETPASSVCYGSPSRSRSTAFRDDERAKPAQHAAILPGIVSAQISVRSKRLVPCPINSTPPRHAEEPHFMRGFASASWGGGCGTRH